MKTLFFLILAISNIAFAQVNKETYIVKFNQQALVHYSGNISQFKATSPRINGTKKFDAKSDAAKAYLSYLENDLSNKKKAIEQILNRSVGKTIDYYYANYGMALKLTANEVNLIKSIKGFVSIEKDTQYTLSTDAGPTFIGANTLWDGSAMPNSTPNLGEGVIVGVIDTGVNMDHPSFSDLPEDGYDFAAANPLGAGNFVVGSDCGVSFVCNNKLIGAWDFADGAGENDGPEDSNGHGSHTASTAVGNKITAPLGGFTTTQGANLNAPSISGVAPHAHLITYDVCVNSCSFAAINGAVNQAIADGVDVISFSISGGLNPWVDGDRTFLDAVAAGILVSAAAGNTSPSTPNAEANVNHRGPWLLSVANSSHSRASKNTVEITNPSPVPSDLSDVFSINGSTDNFTGVDINSGLIYAGNVEAGNAKGCSPFTDNTAFTGNIALIIRGDCDFSVKINNADTAGAIAVIVFNGVSDTPFSMGGIGSTSIPAVMIGLADGDAIVDFIQSVVATNVTAIISAVAVYAQENVMGNILSDGSLTGPNNSFDVTKPDINGPGTLILAAYADGNSPAPQFNFISGTSMAAPHASGSAALMIAAHPSWTPTEIQSAMMMTANKMVRNTALVGATPDQVGSGTVDLSKAALSPLVMSETFANFEDANPNIIGGGDPATLNIPSMRHNACSGNCSWVRTVTNKSASSLTWTTPEFKLIDNTVLLQVTPATFALAPNESQAITVDFTVCPNATLNNLMFSDVVLEPTDPAFPSSRLTVVAKPTGLGDCSNIPLGLDQIFVNGFE